MSVPQPTGEHWEVGWVAVLDVMGFRRLYFENPERLANLYRRSLDRSYEDARFGRFSVTDAAGKEHHVQLTVKIFSDSIFVFSRFDRKAIAFPENEKAAGNLRDSISVAAFFSTMHAAGRVCDSFLLEGLPIRGGVAYGSIHIDESKQYESLDFDRSIYMGDALITAYEWQEQQEWCWYSVAPSSASLVPKPQAMDEYCFAPVPTKNGFVETYAGMVGSWNLGDGEKQFALAQHVADELEKAFQSNDTKHIARWKHTAAFLNVVGVPVQVVTRIPFEKWEFSPEGNEVTRSLQLVPVKGHSS